MNLHPFAPPLAATLARWTARLLGTLLALMMIAIMIGERYNPFTMEPGDALQTLLVPVGGVAGVLLAWRWERLGGGLALGCVATWLAIQTARGGGFPRGGFAYALLLPGLLFLLSALLRRPRSTPTAA